MKVVERLREETAIKTTIGVFMTVVFYWFYNGMSDTSLIVITLTNAIYGIRPNTIDAWIFLRYRLLGTGIGCLLGLVYLSMSSFMGGNSQLSLLMIPLFTYITIVLSGGESAPTTVNGAVMTLITMTLLVPPSNDKNYVLNRILATLVGLIISILVNWVISPTKEHPLRDLKDSVKK